MFSCIIVILFDLFPELYFIYLSAASITTIDTAASKLFTAAYSESPVNGSDAVFVTIH